MNHVALSVQIKPSWSITGKRRDSDIAQCGGLYHRDTDYQKAARALSKLPWVERVVATHVSEHPLGVWRGGRKS